MSALANCQIVGRWRIVESDIWDRDYLDLCGPAAITITAHWSGFDEMDEVSGEGSADLLDDGSIEIEFAYHCGDEAVLKAKREPFSAACSHVRSQPF
jgi:hypothetical protein